ncbi:MAG: saccharopine dehydrogenase family protein [Solirubrobacterales bacterium]
MESGGQWMVYGANGYSGGLIAREAARRGMRPILAGRNAEKIKPLAKELELEDRVFGLTDPEKIAAGLEGIELVLHCAGPFSATSAPMIDGCLQAGAHYLDISGEISVFEHAHSLTDKAGQANVVVCPGVGFDVVPTDCIAVTLKEAMPDATHLSLAFESRSGLSPGTAKTAVEGLRGGGAVRVEGKIKDVPQAYRTRMIDCGNGIKDAMTIPWGDVSTAFHSTAIPNIEVYTTVPGNALRAVKVANHMGWLWRQQRVIDGLQGLVERFVEGPDAEARAGMPTYVWGEVRNSAGQTKTARVKTANGYDVTIEAPLAIVERLMSDPPAGGSYTPAILMGKEFVTELPGSTGIELSD